jgi:hypothetical protein
MAAGSGCALPDEKTTALKTTMLWTAEAQNPCATPHLEEQLVAQHRGTSVALQ